MMDGIQFRIAAKTDVGLERNNNEDNFQVSANLDESPMKWVNNQEYTLGRKGALLVVADGMGGMNAGEVASEIAINTVREMFSPENITDEIVKSRYTIEKFMKGVIVEADKRIKAFAKENPESRSMGTTIVIAWLFDGSLYVSWCGDSRAYIFNPATGLFQISKDHSYVQDLVDAGKLSQEEAFDFPDSNIITRSLGDSTPKPNPDCLVQPQKLCNNDIILLCSDGLNGMIRDGEIENIIARNQGNMTECVDELIKAALDAAGADNCTVALCQILSGGEESCVDRVPKHIRKRMGDNGSDTPRKKHFFWIVGILLLICLGLISGWYYYGTVLKKEAAEILLSDSLNREKTIRDSIQKVKQDSVLKVKRDSSEKARRDSLEIAVRDSVIKANKVKDLSAKVKVKAKDKSREKGDLPLDDMVEIKNSKIK